MKLFAAVFIFTLVSLTGFAQRVCATHDYELRMRHIAPDPLANSASRDTASNEIILIPVVIHVLFNSAYQDISDAQVISQVKVLNEDYRRLNADTSNTPAVFRPAAADARIMFCLAQVDPAGRPSKGIIRRFTNKSSFQADDAMKFAAAGGDDAWDSKKYLNIWVCNMAGRVLGYATPPGGEADKDGVVISFSVFGTVGALSAGFDKGRTTTHEVGHWLGLRHIWGDEFCGSDDVEDTPRQLSYNYNCPSFPHTTSCSENSNGDMFINYMDYTNDACMNMFTNGQKIKMRSVFAGNGSRNSFLNSFACDSSLATGAALPDDTIPVIKQLPEAGVQVFPNPVQQVLNIVSVNGYSLKDKLCMIVSMSGIKLIQKTLINEKDTIDVSSIPAGIYVLKIGNGADKRIIKIIKM